MKPIKNIPKHKGGLCLSTITTSLQTIAPTSCSNNHHYYKYYEYTQIYSQNKVEHKSYLIVTKSNLPGNRFDFVASHEFVTKEPIKMLKSTTFHNLLLIFVDCSLILSYDFQKNIFKEHNNNLNGRSLCFLHYHHFGPRLLIFNNDGHTRRQVLHVDGGKLSCLPYSVDLYPNIVLDSNLIGFVSLEAKHQCDMHENELQIQIIQKIESSQIATSQ
uniref:Uncharacterized protein n=1 Tax=Tetranychus urticae TaxID=32264 RepID=T1KW99_TETUR